MLNNNEKDPQSHCTKLSYYQMTTPLNGQHSKAFVRPMSASNTCVVVTQKMTEYAEVTETIYMHKMGIYSIAFECTTAEFKTITQTECGAFGAEACGPCVYTTHTQKYGWNRSISAHTETAIDTCILRPTYPAGLRHKLHPLALPNFRNLDPRIPILLSTRSPIHAPPSNRLYT